MPLARLCLQILIPYENRTSENMYNKYSISRLQRLIPQVRLPTDRNRRSTHSQTVSPL